MEIKLISKEKHEQLLDIHKNYPVLSFQNEGYQYIPKDKLSNEDKIKISEIEEILKQHISGFYNFLNFRFSQQGKLQIRFKYNYNYNSSARSFAGVGYILVDELLNGFEN